MINDNLATQGTDTMPPKMKFAPVDNDFSPREAEIEKAISEATDIALVDEDLALVEAEPLTNKTLIKSSKQWLGEKLEVLARQQEALQITIAGAEYDKKAREAEAREIFETAIAKAKSEYDDIMSDVEADLFQITECKEALGLAHGRLMRAEL